MAGLLIAPRFRWTHLGDVIGRLGFAVEPSLGGGPLVPGSAREVPPWLLAGPVLSRLEALLSRRRRDFVPREEYRRTPRGRINWSRYASTSLATGRWDLLPCSFSEPDDDPKMMAAVRWTLSRVANSLVSLAPTPIGHTLLKRTARLLEEAGPGARTRPGPDWLSSFGGAWVHEALEAMGWVTQERGLGGSRSLNGLAWDLAIETVWEAWVSLLMSRLGPHLGLTTLSGLEVRHGIQWRGTLKSMGALIPDVGLRGPRRVIWVDAKYKAHLAQLSRTSWPRLSEKIREAHRADLHQALAYAAIANVDNVDTVLAYPISPNDDQRSIPTAIANLTAGRRRVRLVLAGLPFGFRSPTHEDSVIAHWRNVLVH